ncbi:hypothetical protein F5B18DRAFT_653651 [Nemania serpens]|nr:hypothetical protein F5B18DRAFT_653651 [Nemania serpens]
MRLLTEGDAVSKGNPISISEILNHPQGNSNASSSKAQVPREGIEDKEGGVAQTNLTPTRHGPEQHNEEREKFLAKQVAGHIISGIQSDVEAPQSTFWRTLVP